MFTGLVEEVGIITNHINTKDGIEIEINANIIMEDLKVNDSISCSGICLTVTSINDSNFKVQNVEETLSRTTAKTWQVGTKINLERSLLPSSRMGGHFVQGHVDRVIKLIKIIPGQDSAVWHFAQTSDIDKYIVEKGSICLDGISLTIALKEKEYFSVALIPHTLSVTTWKQKKVGELINVEVDIMAKYMESLLGV